MKSLRRSTPLVLMKRSKGGSLAVYMCLSRVSIVIDSGFGRPARAATLFLARNLGGGESGCRVGDDESPSLSFLPSSPSSCSESSGDSSRIVGNPFRSSSCRDRIFCLIREGEKGVVFGGVGARNSWTVDLTAVVISALEV